MNQTITDMLNDEDPNWVMSVMDSTDVAELTRIYGTLKNANRRALVSARLENLNHTIG